MRISTHAGLREPTLFTSEYFGLFESLPENFACSMSWIVAEDAQGVGQSFTASFRFMLHPSSRFLVALMESGSSPLL